MGLDEKLKRIIAPRYRPRSEESLPEQNPMFGESYLEHHNIVSMKWKPNDTEKKEGDPDDR